MKVSIEAEDEIVDKTIFESDLSSLLKMEAWTKKNLVKIQNEILARNYNFNETMEKYP